MNNLLVLCLMELFLDNFNHLYVDNFFTSVKLAKKLFSRNAYKAGTFQKNKNRIHEK